jgi:hypothetical protein
MGADARCPITNRTHTVLESQQREAVVAGGPEAEAKVWALGGSLPGKGGLELS